VYLFPEAGVPQNAGQVGGCSTRLFERVSTSRPEKNKRPAIGGLRPSLTGEKPGTTERTENERGKQKRRRDENMKKIARVFPRRTRATPADAYAFIGEPNFDALPDDIA
jgi:hypothetical protein